MEPEMIFRTVAIVIAAALLLSNFDYSWAVNWTKNLLKKKDIVKPAPESGKEVDFLDVVETWHTLKSQCKALELKEATEKLDEVFPLLNVEE
jgi:hypothetical protein